MFGAPVRSVFRYFAGLQFDRFGALTLSPYLPLSMSRLFASVRRREGDVSVLLERTEAGVRATVTVPSGLAARLCVGERCEMLGAGQSVLMI
jgi:hypothetical protein